MARHRRAGPGLHQPGAGPTDAAGNWTGPGDRAWTDADAGTWVKYVRVNGRLAQVVFVVVP